MICPQCTFPVIPAAAHNCSSCGWAVGTTPTPLFAANVVPLSAPSALHKVVADTTRSQGERNAAQTEINERNV